MNAFSFCTCKNLSFDLWILREVETKMDGWRMISLGSVYAFLEERGKDGGDGAQKAGQRGGSIFGLLLHRNCR